MAEKKAMSPFVLRRREELSQNYLGLLKDREIKFRSPVFDMPEFEDSPLASVCQLFSATNSHSDFPKEWEFLEVEEPSKNKNDCMLLNELGLASSGKIIFLISHPDGFSKTTLVQMSENILTSERSVVCLDINEDAGCLALTTDLFYALRGVDELLKSVTDGLTDLALRAELIGATIESKVEFRDNPKAKRNIQKGRVVVNQGSPVFE